MSTTRAIALTGAASQQAATGTGFYAGLAVRETAGAACVVRVWDGTSAAGTIIDVVSLAANGASSGNAAIYGPVWFATGLFVEKVSGTFEGSIRVG